MLCFEKELVQIIEIMPYFSTVNVQNLKSGRGLRFGYTE